TTGNQSLGGPLTLLANTSFNSSVLGSATNGGGSGNINFTGTVNGLAGSGPFSLAANTQGTTTFGGAVGTAGANNTTALTSLTTDSAGATQFGTATTAVTVNTVGGQTYGDTVTLLNNTTLNSSISGNAASGTGGGNILLQSTVDGPFALAVNTA